MCSRRDNGLSLEKTSCCFFEGPEARLRSVGSIWWAVESPEVFADRSELPKDGRTDWRRRQALEETGSS